MVAMGVEGRAVSQILILYFLSPFIAEATPAVYAGFAGLSDNYTVAPPNAEGAVSPRYVVSLLNSEVLVQSRLGEVRAGYPIPLKRFWAGLGEFTRIFDTRILYDGAARRWIATCAANPRAADSALLVGVSASDDPAGEWKLARIDIGSSGLWADYPVPEFNDRWLTVSVNLFQMASGSAYARSELYVFDKQELYSRGNAAHSTFRSMDGGHTPVRDLDGGSATMYFLQGSAGRAGQVRISTLTGAVGAERFTVDAGRIVLPDGWANTAPAGQDFAPQAGSTARIDTGDARLQNCVLRGGSIWCVHTVFLPFDLPTRSAVEWFQLLPGDLKIAQLGRIDDASATRFYAFPSIAVNGQSDVLIGFTRFHRNEYPSAGFALRKASEAANTLSAETVFKAGEAPYMVPGLSSNRWGDYSTTLVDPADDLSFWTLQPYAATPDAGHVGRWATWWASVVAPSSAPDCAYSISPASRGFEAGGGTASATVTSGAGCVWMAASNVPWVAVESGSPAAGGGTVAFAVAPNTTTSKREGTISIGGQTLVISQLASAPAENRQVDLAVAGISAPARAQSGEQVAISVTATNRSPEPAGPFRIGLYLASDGIVTPGDTLLGACDVETLAAGAAAACERHVTIPWGIVSGPYLIGAIADDKQQINDPDRTNNTRTSAPVDVTLASAVPVIARIVNSASFAAGGVAPGEAVAIFGANLGSPSVQYPAVSGSGVVDTVAAGTRVLFDGTPAPLLYVTSTQVGAIVPFGVGVRASTAVQVESLGVRSAALELPVVASAPGVFTANSSGSGAGAILNQDYSANSPSRPAERGSVVTIYATGGGAMQDPVVDGALGTPPWTQLSQRVAVRIGDLPAQVIYAGESAGIVQGIVQINAFVPTGAASGEVTLSLIIGGVSSFEHVTMYIR